MIVSKPRLPLLCSVLLAISPAAFADIYKCIQPDGTPLFQADCPPNTVSSTKLSISEISDLGFNKNSQRNLAIGEELLTNGGFESHVDSWLVRGDAETLPKEGTAGTTALRAYSKGDVASKTRLRQCLPVTGIGKASISAFIKQEGSADLRNNELRVVSFTSDDCSTGGEYNAQLNPTAAPGWQKLSQTDLVPSLGAKSIMVEIVHINEGGDPAEALWDEIEFTLTEVDHNTAAQPVFSQYTRPIGENHLYNSDFENGLESWQTGWPAKWNEYGGQDVSGGAHITANSNFGKKIRGEALSQCVNIGANKTFKVGVSFKQDQLSSQQGNGLLRVAWMQNIDCSGRQQLGGSYETTTSNNWQTLGGSVNAPEGAQSALIRMYQTIDNTGMYGAFWDNAFFIATE